MSRLPRDTALALHVRLFPASQVRPGQCVRAGGTALVASHEPGFLDTVSLPGPASRYGISAHEHLASERVTTTILAVPAMEFSVNVAGPAGIAAAALAAAPPAAAVTATTIVVTSVDPGLAVAAMLLSAVPPEQGHE